MGSSGLGFRASDLYQEIQGEARACQACFKHLATKSSMVRTLIPNADARQQEGAESHSSWTTCLDGLSVHLLVSCLCCLLPAFPGRIRCNSRRNRRSKGRIRKRGSSHSTSCRRRISERGPSFGYSWYLVVSRCQVSRTL